MVRPVPDEVIARLRAAGCVFAEDEARLLVEAADSPDRLAELVDARVAGEPLEYLLGWADFCGLRVAVSTGVFVPRRRSELLVRVAAPLLAPRGRVVDLCCGSGAIGLAIARRIPVELYAVDVDPGAVAVARENLFEIGAKVFEGDLFAPLPPSLRGRVDLVVANAPYVPTDEIALMPAEARDHEHRAALDGGPDGLVLHRRIAAAAPGWLTSAGVLLIETSAPQAAGTSAAMAAAGLVTRVEADDEIAGTVVIGRRG